MIICVIGGGPAGLMSACFSKSSNNQVILFDKNEKLGKKLYITGKGRCNVTNEKCVGEQFLNNVVVNSKFLYSSINAFDYYDVVSFFEKNGCPLKVEQGGRVFPVSDKASDITKALTKACEDAGVEIKLNYEITFIDKKDNKFIIGTNKGKILCDKVIICTGGKSYPITGSTGDGYKFAKILGHKIVQPLPSLIAIRLNSNYTKDLEGLSLKNISLNYECENKLVKSIFGEALFTDKELSGPVALTMSAVMQHEKGDTLYIDFKPALNQEQLDKRILKEFEIGVNKDIKNLLKELLPARLIDVFLKVCGIDGDKKINSITKTERQTLARVLKRFELNYTMETSFERAVVTTGGVDVKEINSKTMESKLCPNLYFAGEVIDVDAYTGGFNIQIALSTGFLAGINAKGD